MSSTHQITTTEAREAARRFIRKAEAGLAGLDYAEGCLPNGYILSESVTDDAFMPMTVENVTTAFRTYAVRA